MGGLPEADDHNRSRTFDNDKYNKRLSGGPQAAHHEEEGDLYAPKQH